jgi:hypothetical protein
VFDLVLKGEYWSAVMIKEVRRSKFPKLSQKLKKKWKGPAQDEERKQRMIYEN